MENDLFNMVRDYDNEKKNPPNYSPESKKEHKNRRKSKNGKKVLIAFAIYALFDILRHLFLDIVYLINLI